MKRFLISFLVVFAFASVQAQTYVELILDASGSMWNKLEDGNYRITAAKEVLSDFIKNLPNGDLNVGLRVYGSEVAALDEGSCEDSKLFVPLAGVDKGALQSTVDRVTATGATPIALSLQKAAQDFPSDASQRMIILVTDGEESCGGDLQAVAAELKQQGFEIDLKIIGFALDERAQQSFEGIGEFVNAADASELAGALEGAVEEVVTEPIVEHNLERNAVSLIAAAITSAGKALDIAYEGDIQENDYITIVSSDTKDGLYKEFSYVDTVQFSPISLTAPFEPGTYEIRYMDEVRGQDDAVLARMTLTVESSDITLAYPAEILLGSTFDVAWTGPNGESDYITVVPLGAREGLYTSYFYLADSDGTGTLTAPSVPGQYEIRYTTDRATEKGKNFYSQPITVLPATYSLEVAAEITAGTLFEVTWSGPNGNDDYITIVPEGAPEGQYLSYFYLTSGNPATLTAPSDAGNYEIRYTTDRSGAKGTNFYSIPVTIVPAQFNLSAVAEVVMGESFEVTWDGPNGPNDYITIVKTGATEGSYLSYAYLTSGNPVSLIAPDEAGSYEIRYTTDRSGDKGRTFYSIPITVR